jgi:hypothetical protein
LKRIPVSPWCLSIIGGARGVDAALHRPGGAGVSSLCTRCQVRSLKDAYSSFEFARQTSLLISTAAAAAMARRGRTQYAVRFEPGATAPCMTGKGAHCRPAALARSVVSLTAFLLKLGSISPAITNCRSVKGATG